MKYYHKGDKTIRAIEPPDSSWESGPSESWKQKVNETRKKTLQDRYGKDIINVSQIKQVKEKIKDKAKEIQLKREQTSLERYGVENYTKSEIYRKEMSDKIKSKEVQRKMRQTCLDKYGVESCFQSEDVKDRYKNTIYKNYGVISPLQSKEIMEKKNKTMIKRYGTLIPINNEEIRNKRLHTLKERNTFNSSQPEEDVYNYLCSILDKDDVIRQYSDNRYPFRCDFYIKSKDLFIELNLHPSHGDNIFDENNEEDLNLLETLRNNKDRWSNMIIHTWHDYDPIKVKIAKQNNLNIKFIYSKEYYSKSKEELFNDLLF